MEHRDACHSGVYTYVADEEASTCPRLLTILVIWSSYAIGQSRVELLKSVEHYCASSNSFVVKGQASAILPGTSWKVSYSFETQAMQSSFIPPDVRSAEMLDISRVGSNFTLLA